MNSRVSGTVIGGFVSAAFVHAGGGVSAASSGREMARGAASREMALFMEVDGGRPDDLPFCSDLWKMRAPSLPVSPVASCRAVRKPLMRTGATGCFGELLPLIHPMTRTFAFFAAALLAAPVFATEPPDVQHIFAEYCLECHGPDKA